jgi:hypothetical protein
MVARILPAWDLTSQWLSFGRRELQASASPPVRHAQVSQLKRSGRVGVARAKHRDQTAQNTQFCLALAVVTVTLVG